jgi:hypothetical protein
MSDADELWVLLAKQAGLDLALAEFREDVAAAASSATATVSGLVVPSDPKAEPWPPMRVGAAR